MASSNGAHPQSATESDTATNLAQRHATERSALHLNDVSLIGVVGPIAGPSVLLRLKNGRILKLAMGENSPEGTVAAIGANAVKLSRRGRIKSLKMP